MNIIEAWKRAKEGQRIRRPSWESTGGWGFEKGLRESFHEAMKTAEGDLSLDLLADDWEIVKEKKEITEGYIMGSSECIWPEEVSKIPFGTTVTITWKWEE